MVVDSGSTDEHAVHATPSEAAKYPTIHLQSVNASLCATELVPTGHVKQPPAPVTELYVPSGHVKHSPIPVVDLYVPIGHRSQSFSESLPGGELFPTGHIPPQTVTIATSEYVPDWHGTQLVPSQ